MIPTSLRPSSGPNNINSFEPRAKGRRLFQLRLKIYEVSISDGDVYRLKNNISFQRREFIRGLNKRNIKPSHLRTISWIFLNPLHQLPRETNSSNTLVILSVSTVDLV